MGERQTISHVSFLSLVCQSMALQSPQDQGHTLWLDIQAFQYVLSLVIPSTTSHLFAYSFSIIHSLIHSFIHPLSHTHMFLYPDPYVNCWKHQDEQMEFCLEKDSSNIWPFTRRQCDLCKRMDSPKSRGSEAAFEWEWGGTRGNPQWN